MILDCGCSRSLVGSETLKEFARVCQHLILNVSTIPTCVYQFAGGEKAETDKSARILIAGEVISFNVLPNSYTPFLLGNDFLGPYDHVSYRRRFIQKHENAPRTKIVRRGGLYYLDVPDALAMEQESDEPEEGTDWAYIADLTLQAHGINLTYADAVKIHRSLWHADVDQMLQRYSGIISDSATKALSQAVVDNCGTCQQMKKQKPQSKIGKTTTAKAVGDLVAMGTIYVTYNNRSYAILHLVDAHSKYSMARVCPGLSSTGQDAIALLKQYRFIFGRYPTAIMTDNGSEFRNHELCQEMCEHMVRHFFSPADAHASNGLIESHNRVLEETLKRLTNRESHGYSCLTLDDFMLEALTAKNAYVRSHGFSAQEVALGQKTTYDESAQDISSSFKTKPSDISQFLKQRKASRLEASKLVNVAAELKEVKSILSSSRPTPQEHFSLGDCVLVQLDTDKNDLQPNHSFWVGATVVGLKGSRVLIVESADGLLKEVHASRTRRAGPGMWVNSPEIPEEGTQNIENPEEGSQKIENPQEGPRKDPEEGQQEKVETSSSGMDEKESEKERKESEEKASEIDAELVDIVRDNSTQLYTGCTTLRRHAIKRSMFTNHTVQRAYMYKDIEEIKCPTLEEGERAVHIVFNIKRQKPKYEGMWINLTADLPLDGSRFVVTIVHKGKHRDRPEIGNTRQKGAHDKAKDLSGPNYREVPEDRQSKECLGEFTMAELRWLAATRRVPLAAQKQELLKRLRADFEREEFAALCNGNLVAECEYTDGESECCYLGMMKSAEKVSLRRYRDLFLSLLREFPDASLDSDSSCFEDLRALCPEESKSRLAAVLLGTGRNWPLRYRSLRQYDLWRFVIPSDAPAYQAGAYGEPIRKSDVQVTFAFEKLPASLSKTEVKQSKDGADEIFVDLPMAELAKGTIEVDYKFLVENNLETEAESAFRKEFGQLLAQKIYSVIPRKQGEKVSMGSKIIWAIKTKPSGALKRVKVRFVPKGFGDARNDQLRKDQDVLSGEGLLMILALAARRDWRLWTTDFLTAFLQSKPYADGEQKPISSFPLVPNGDAKWFEMMGCPKEQASSHAMQYNKACYGLTDGPRRWYLTFTDFLRECGFTQVSADLGIWALYTTGENGEIVRPTAKNPDHKAEAESILHTVPRQQEFPHLSGVIGLHVDDTICGGDETFWATWKKVCERFTVGEEEEITTENPVSFCGRVITKSPKGYAADQQHYCEKLAEIEVGEIRADEVAPDHVQGEYRKAIGKLNWISYRTHAEICHEVNALSSRQGKATGKDLAHLNKVIRRARHNRSITIQAPRMLNRLQIVAFSDASFNRLNPSDKSYIGTAIYLAEVPEDCQTYGRDNASTVYKSATATMATAGLVYWRSTTIKRKIDTILDGEVIATQYAYNLAKYLHEIASALHLTRPDDPVLVLNDNSANVSHVKSTNRHQNPRLNSIWTVLRDNFTNGNLQLRWVCGKLKNVADALTKPKSALEKLLIGSIVNTRIEIPEK